MEDDQLEVIQRHFIWAHRFRRLYYEQQGASDHPVAPKATDRAWFAGDALNAEDVLDGPGGAPIPKDCNDPPDNPPDTVTLTWTDTSGKATRHATADACRRRLPRSPSSAASWAKTSAGQG